MMQKDLMERNWMTSKDQFLIHTPTTLNTNFRFHSAHYNFQYYYINNEMIVYFHWPGGTRTPSKDGTTFDNSNQSCCWERRRNHYQGLHGI